MGKLFFHIDLDSFYAAVEQVDNCAYRGKPVIVGGDLGSRGVVSTCSYEARAFGVHSAMPMFQAQRLCPEGIFLPVRMGRYVEVSGRIMNLFNEFSPKVQQISVDEAFLDMTGTERLMGSPQAISQKIKGRIAEVSGLTASIGVASNRYIAKLASAYQKPDGLTIVNTGEETTFIDTIPLDKIWGVGFKTYQLLFELNIQTVQDLRGLSREELTGLLGKGTADFLYTVSRGEDPGILAQNPKSHSISSETTFGVDVSDMRVFEMVLLELAHDVMFRMLREDSSSSTVVLKLKYHDFTVVSSRKRLGHPVASTGELFTVSRELLSERWNGSTPVRLIGVGVVQVEKGRSVEGQELFETTYSRQGKVERAILDLRGRGQRLIKASLLKKKEKLGENGTRDSST